MDFDCICLPACLVLEAAVCSVTSILCWIYEELPIFILFHFSLRVWMEWCLARLFHARPEARGPDCPLLYSALSPVSMASLSLDSLTAPSSLLSLFPPSSRKFRDLLLTFFAPHVASPWRPRLRRHPGVSVCTPNLCVANPPSFSHGRPSSLLPLFVPAL